MRCATRSQAVVAAAAVAAANAAAVEPTPTTAINVARIATLPTPTPATFLLFPLRKVVVIGLFGDSPEQKKVRGVFRRVGASEEFAGVGMVVADSTEDRLLKVGAVGVRERSLRRALRLRPTRSCTK